MALSAGRSLCAFLLFCSLILPAFARDASDQPAPAPVRPHPKSSVAQTSLRHIAGCVDRLAALDTTVSPSVPADVEKVSAQTFTLVEIHADGSIASTGVYRSSQNERLDQAADEAASKSTYHAARKNCVAYSSFVVLRTPFEGGEKTLAPATQACAESAALLKSLAKPADKNSTSRSKRSGSAIVDVTVGTDGTVSASEIVETSGIDSLDADALRVAKASSYYPGRSGCKPIESSVKLELTYF